MPSISEMTWKGRGKASSPIRSIGSSRSARSSRISSTSSPARARMASTARGVNVIALSSDTAERAQAMADKLKAPDLRMGHSLPLPVARAWGLYVSTSRGTTSIGIEEPALFSEPGVFLVRPDGSLYYGAVQTMPFARPHFDELLAAIDFAVAKDYPARGEYTGEV